MYAEMKAFEIQDHEKKVVSAASLPDAGRDAVFVRDRCRYVRERCRSLKISCEFKKQCR